MENQNNQFLSHFNSLLEVMDYFKDEKVANQYLNRVRWEEHPVCPHCASEKIYCFSDCKRFKCKSCRKQFTARIGTIFENSKIPLRKWFVAIYVFLAHKKGISSHQLARDIRVTQKTAWFMLHRIRHLLGIENDDTEKMSGTVSIDESWVGGKNKNRHKDKKYQYIRNNTGDREFKDKTPILGFMTAAGRVRTIVVSEVKKHIILPLVYRNVKVGSKVVTDDWRSYRLLSTNFDHEIVRHGDGRYSSYNGYSTNNLEGFWTWIKRMVIGIYHKVSRKYMQYYANEATFRYNTRTLSDVDRLVYALSNSNGCLKHKMLTQYHE